MLIEPQSQLLNKGEGFAEFISQKRYDDIKLLYQLYKEEKDCLKPIGDAFRHYITEQGKDTLKMVALCSPEGKTLGVKEIIGSS